MGDIFLFVEAMSKECCEDVFVLTIEENNGEEVEEDDEVEDVGGDFMTFK
jgi:hypothetical protein